MLSWCALSTKLCVVVLLPSNVANLSPAGQALALVIAESSKSREAILGGGADLAAADRAEAASGVGTYASGGGGAQAVRAGQCAPGRP